MGETETQGRQRSRSSTLGALLRTLGWGALALLVIQGTCAPRWLEMQRERVLDRLQQEMVDRFGRYPEPRRLTSPST